MYEVQTKQITNNILKIESSPLSFSRQIVFFSSKEKKIKYDGKNECQTKARNAYTNQLCTNNKNEKKKTNCGIK